MTVLSSDSDAMAEFGAGDESPVQGVRAPYDRAYQLPPNCPCGSFDCDDVSIEVICAHLGIPAHPLAELFGDHMTRQESEAFEVNFRRTYKTT